MEPFKIAEQDLIAFYVKNLNIEYGFGLLLVNITGSASILGKDRIALPFWFLYALKNFRVVALVAGVL